MDDPLEKANQRIGELRREITAKLKQVKDLEQRNTTLTQTVEQHEKAIKALAEQKASDDKRRAEAEEEKWAEYNATMAKVREEGKALEEQRIKLDNQRLRQQKEIADNRALVDQWEATVDNVRRESDAIKQTNIQQLQQYQQQYIALQEETAQLKRTYSERLHALDQRLSSTQDESRAKDDVLERQALSIKTLEQAVMAAREEKEQQWKAYRDRTEENNRQHEVKVAELTDQYLALCRESESIIGEVKREVEWRGDKMSVLQQWELTRERVEDENKTLKSNYQKLLKQQENDKKERARLDRENDKEMKALRDSIHTLQSDKELLTKELNTKKAALKVYKDEFEAKQRARIETEEKERARAAADKAAGSRGGLGSAISSLFGGKKRDDEPINGVQPRTVHPSAIGSGADKGFLDLEEEMAVALTERVERLSEEKGKLEDDMIVLQRQLEQEKIVAAQLRQQLKLEGKEAPGSRSVEERKRDKLVLSPENTAKVLSDTIARNRELEEVKREQEKEIKRLKAQVEVKKQELKEAERKRGASVGGGGLSTPVKSRSNSTMGTTQAGVTQTGGVGVKGVTRGPSNGDLTTTGGGGGGVGGSGGGGVKEG